MFRFGGKATKATPQSLPVGTKTLATGRVSGGVIKMAIPAQDDSGDDLIVENERHDRGSAKSLATVSFRDTGVESERHDEGAQAATNGDGSGDEEMRAFMQRAAKTERALLDRIEALEKGNDHARGGGGDESGRGVDLEGVDLFGESSGRGEDDEKDSIHEPGQPQALRMKRTSIWKFEVYELPQSTYTLLISEDVLSGGFFVGIAAAVMAMLTLAIVLYNEIQKGNPDSRWGMPAGVEVDVRMAQYLGLIIGVLMEEEVPLGLEIIGVAFEQKLLGRRPYEMKKVIFSSVLRMIVGYMFLVCLFMTVIQESDVLSIFFDVLALEFVEKLDDILYSLLKRGFFGKYLRKTAHMTHKFQARGRESNSASRKIARRMKHLVKIVYFCNAGVLIILLTVLTLRQDSGAYRCNSIEVAFGDNVWEQAWAKRDGGGYEERLLIYSHFNGKYKENGRTKDGRPRYTEMNKEDGLPFRETIGAEILYCEKLEAWVFRHPKITTSPFDSEEEVNREEENECSWLLRSPTTDSFDIIEVGADSPWSVWTGQIDESTISISCNDCNDPSDCNYHGKCIDGKCVCDNNMQKHGTLHFGTHCEFEQPCEVIRSSKDPNSTLHLMHDADHQGNNFVKVYGHPKYVANMQGKPDGLLRKGDINDDAFEDDDFFDIHMQQEPFQELIKNYTFVLKYTGRRWYGQIQPPGVDSESFVEEEFHAFWNKAFTGVGVDDNKTVIISDPSTHASPVGVNFYEMRRRNKEFETGEENYNYGPFGVLIEMFGAQGAGYFHCNKDPEKGDPE